MMKTMVMAVWLLFLLTLTHWAQAEELADLLTGGSTAKESTAAAPDKVIAVEHSAQNDQKIKKRLEQIFSELDDLKGVKASVSNGVITLQGSIDSNAAEAKALEFAKHIEEVVEVENQLVVSHSLSKRLQKTLVKMTTLSCKTACKTFQGPGEKSVEKFPPQVVQ